MAKSPAFRFFTPKRVKDGFMLFIRGKQAGSVYKQANGWVAFLAKNGECSDYYPTAEAAEAFVWAKWC